MINLELLAESIYGKGIKPDYEEGFVDGYNQAKENYEVESSVRELHIYKLGFNDGYNQAKNKFTISDEVLFELATVAMESHYGYGCETEIDAYFRGAKWILKQFKNT